MRAPAVLILSLLIAGCLESPSAPSTPDGPPAPFVRYAIPVWAYANVDDGSPCVPVQCVEDGAVVILALLDNQTATGFDLEVRVWAPSETYLAPPQVHVELTCQVDPSCTGVVASMDLGATPDWLHSNRTFGPRTRFVLTATTASSTTDVGGFSEPRVWINGAVFIQAAPAPPPPTHDTHFHEEGVTSVCVLTVECNTGPYEFFDLGPYDGQIQSLDLNVTWAATDPLEESLNLSVTCNGPNPNCFGQQIFAQGPSPLRLVTDRLPFGPRIALEIHIQEPNVPPGNMGVPGGARQSYTLDGTVTWKELAES